MELMTITLDKVEEFLSTIPSKNTRKSYVSGLKRFEAYYGKSGNITDIYTRREPKQNQTGRKH